MLLTISIPTHNSTHYLDEALQSIIKEPGLGVFYEITLSDNSLTSDTEYLYRTKYINIKGINVYDILNNKKLIITKDSLSNIMERCQ